MRLAFAVALPSQLLLLVKPILAQTARGVLVPVGAHVKIDTESGGQSVEGTIVAWRGDTLLVQPQSRTDTVRVASGALKKLRVVESPALWRYTSPSTINFYFSTAIPRAHDVTSRSGDAYERLLLVGTKTELAGVNTSTGAVLWSRKDLADIKNASLDIAWNSGFGVVSRRDTMEILDLRTGQALGQWIAVLRHRARLVALARPRHRHPRSRPHREQRHDPDGRRHRHRPRPLATGQCV